MYAAKFSRLVPVSLALMWLAFVPGATLAAENGQPPSSNDEQAFLARAMSDNSTQIAAAKLALAKSTNPRIVALANAIIQERTELDGRLAQLLSGTDRGAREQNASSDAMIGRLQALDGEAFDRTFASSMVRSHCRLISAYQAMKLNASDPALKDLAHDAVPALRGNLTVALSVLRSSGWTSSRHQQVAVANEGRGAKATPVFWQPISLVAAPW